MGLVSYALVKEKKTVNAKYQYITNHIGYCQGLEPVPEENSRTGTFIRNHIV